MFLTVHAAAAMLISGVTTNPLVGFCLGLASHFTLDAIPHGDEHIVQAHFTRSKKLRRIAGAAMVDVFVLVLFLGIYLTGTPQLTHVSLLWTLLGALLPDLLQGLFWITESKWLKWFNDLHIMAHNGTRYHLHWMPGMLVQCLVFTALWLALI